MDMIQWIFDGIGTEILAIIISLGVGGLAGYKIGVKHTSKQKQVADDFSKQRQEFEIDSKNLSGAGSAKIQSEIKQSQKAGSNSEQIQVGRVTDDRR